MKATAFFSSTVAILFSSTLFLAGCAGLAGVSSSAPPAPTATSAPPPPPPPPSGAPTSTFVYVLSNPGSNNFEINAFSADANGQLTPVPGSPFAANVHAMAANQKYLFGTDGANIDSFSIAPNGALTQLSSINIRQFNPQGGLGNLFPDRTGTSLYAAHARIDGANDGYDLFSVDQFHGSADLRGRCIYLLLRLWPLELQWKQFVRIHHELFSRLCGDIDVQAE